MHAVLRKYLAPKKGIEEKYRHFLEAFQNGMTYPPFTAAIMQLDSQTTPKSRI